MKKKLAALFLSVILVMGIMIPAQAAEATAETKETSTATATDLSPSQQHMFLMFSMILQMRDTLDVPAELESIAKAVDALKADAKEIQLTSNQVLSIFFYSIETEAKLSVNEKEQRVQCSWVYALKDGSELQFTMYPETLVQTVSTSKHTAAVTIK